MRPLYGTAVKAYRNLKWNEQFYKENMQVDVVRGPLQGVHGILLRKEKRHRLVLGVRLIQQAAAVEIDVNDVLPI